MNEEFSFQYIGALPGWSVLTVHFEGENDKDFWIDTDPLIGWVIYTEKQPRLDDEDKFEWVADRIPIGARGSEVCVSEWPEGVYVKTPDGRIYGPSENYVYYGRDEFEQKGLKDLRRSRAIGRIAREQMEERKHPTT